jgi:hypothetical protein
MFFLPFWIFMSFNDSGEQGVKQGRGVKTDPQGTLGEGGLAVVKAVGPDIGNKIPVNFPCRFGSLKAV